MPSHYGPTPLRMVHWGNQTILGGGCRRFGCCHTFAQHEMGNPGTAAAPGQPYVPATGGNCTGTRQHHGNGPDTPCDCPSFQADG